MTPELEQYVKSLVEKIVEVIPVEEIFLFGSYAYGSPNEDSDIDLCILTTTNGNQALELIKRARKAIAPISLYPVDLLVYTKEEFIERASIKTTLEYKIKREE